MNDAYILITDYTGKEYIEVRYNDNNYQEPPRPRNDKNLSHNLKTRHVKTVKIVQFKL